MTPQLTMVVVWLQAFFYPLETIRLQCLCKLYATMYKRDVRSHTRVSILEILEPFWKMSYNGMVQKRGATSLVPRTRNVHA